MAESICKCCAINVEEFPKVLCLNEPYGDVIDPIEDCKDFITEEDQETLLSCFYKMITAKQWRSLDHQARKRLNIEIREICQIP